MPGGRGESLKGNAADVDAAALANSDPAPLQIRPAPRELCNFRGKARQGAGKLPVCMCGRLYPLKTLFLFSGLLASDLVQVVGHLCTDLRLYCTALQAITDYLFNHWQGSLLASALLTRRLFGRGHAACAGKIELKSLSKLSIQMPAIGPTSGSRSLSRTLAPWTVQGACVEQIS